MNEDLVINERLSSDQRNQGVHELHAAQLCVRNNFNNYASDKITVDFLVSLQSIKLQINTDLYTYMVFGVVKIEFRCPGPDFQS